MYVNMSFFPPPELHAYCSTPGNISDNWFALVAVTQSTIWTVAELNVPIMACCLVVLAKPIVNLMSPILKHIPMFASRFRTTTGYGANYGKGKTEGSRYQKSEGWQRAEGETSVTIGGGRMRRDKGFGGSGGGYKGNSNILTSDGASDESILGFQKKTYPAGPGSSSENEAVEMHTLKQSGIVRTVAVDVHVSDRDL